METCARCALEMVRWKELACPADVLQVTMNVTMAIWEHSGEFFVRVSNAEQQPELPYYFDEIFEGLFSLFVKHLAV